MGEIVLAVVGGQVTICEELHPQNTEGKLVLKTGRNKETRVSENRIIHRTGVKTSSPDIFQQYRETVDEISKTVDLENAWHLVKENLKKMTAAEVAQLWPEPDISPEFISGIVMKINSGSTYFKRTKNMIEPRSISEVTTIKNKLASDKQKQAESDSLLSSLADGNIHDDLTDYQNTLLNHLKKFVVHGNSYRHSKLITELIAEKQNVSSVQAQNSAFNLLVKSNVFSQDEPLELIKCDVPVAFEDEIFAELETLPNLLPNHSLKDLTNLPTFSIDSESTRDKDDAISIDGNAIWIHISDISSLVSENSAIGNEAYLRSESLYTPEQTIPMLPVAISENIGSLLSKVERQCLSLKVSVNENRDDIDCHFAHTLISNDHDLSYEQCDEILLSSESPIKNMLEKARLLSEFHHELRINAGAFELEGREMGIDVTVQKNVKIEVINRHSPSRNIVEELMVIYNNFAGQYCLQNDVPTIYRTQASPGHAMPSQLPDGPLGRYEGAKLLRPAVISTRPGPHFGLALDHYSRATSPIRRYQDLMVQGQILHHMYHQKIKYTSEEMISKANACGQQSRILSRVENSRNRYWFLKFLDQNLSARNHQWIMPAIVLETKNDQRAILELTDYPFRIRCSLHATSKPGDEIDVSLKGVDLWNRSAQFVLAQ